MDIKFSFWIFAITILAAACAPLASEVTHIVPTASSSSTSAITSATESKNKDLILVEFFAGT